MTALSKYLEEEDETMEPEPPAPEKDVVMKAVTGDGSGIGKATGLGGETGISKAISFQRGPWLHTVNVRMPYRSVQTLTLNCSKTDSAGYNTTTVRLNSIYDCMSTNAWVENPTAAADTADATVNTPMFRKYYEDLYQYWTVLGSKYEVNIKLILPDANRNNTAVDCYVYEHGLQKPPPLAGGNIIPFQYRRLHPNLKHHQILQPVPSSGSSFNGVASDYKLTQPQHVYTGYYNRGSVNHEVIEDELNQTWHKMTEVPPLQEKATIHLQRNDRCDGVFMTPYDGLVTCIVEIMVDYFVQFKDLKVAFEYISQNTAQTGISTVLAQTN